jgi:DNA-binding XRE family transcriptional regulator
MTRKWDEIRRPPTPDRRERIDRIKGAMNDAIALSELRQGRGMSQTDVAHQLDVSQARVSKIEREDDLYLSTLRRYVEAMGGSLELRAVFQEDGQEVRIK